MANYTVTVNGSGYYWSYSITNENGISILPSSSTTTSKDEAKLAAKNDITSYLNSNNITSVITINFNDGTIETNDVDTSETLTYSDADDDFINETGHTEDTEEEVPALSIFDDNNIITEDLLGVKFTNDEQHGDLKFDLTSTIEDIESLSDTTKLLAANGTKADDSPSTISTETAEVTNSSTGKRTSKNTFQAAIQLALATNSFGQFITKGSKCSVCGKEVRFMPPNGYCSVECAAKALANKLLSAVTGDYETETPDLINKIRNILSEINLVINIISKFPDVLAGMASFPDEWKAYATAKMNIVFLEIKKVLNLLLIKKNQLIIKMLRRIKFGTIDDKLKPAFAVINQIITAVETARAALENALAVAYQAINGASGMFYIGPLEYGIFWTLKSMMAPCMSFKTDATLYPPALLGRPYWGGTTMCIAFDLSKCQFSTDIGAKSSLLNVDFTKINAIIRKIFLPILAPEYLMDPDLFDMRLALSDLNAPTIEKMVKLLELLVVKGADLVPTYANLKLTNIWFVLGILCCWGPTTRSIFGDFIFHGAL